MLHFSPLTVKRFRSFRRIRRAWYSLIALGVIFAFCMCAELVCPYAPNQLAKSEDLQRYCRPVELVTYDVRTARFNLMDDGTIAEYEGPAALRETLARTPREKWADPAVTAGYRVDARPRAGAILSG